MNTIYSTALLLILQLATLCTIAQNRPPQNVRRVIVTSKYEFVNGKRTVNSRAIKQEIKDSLDRVHTILYRDYETQLISRHIWHTFEGKQIVRTDEFANEKLFRFSLFSYTPDSLISRQEVFMATPADTNHYATLIYKYQNRLPVKVKALNGKGKQIYVTKSKFDANGTEIERKVIAKNGFSPIDSVMNLICKPAYDSLNRKVAESWTKTYFDGKKETKQYRYQYNPKGLLTIIEELSADGSPITRKTLEYNEKNMLKFISLYNAEGTLIDYQAIRYELYPTLNRHNRIIEY